MTAAIHEHLVSLYGTAAAEAIFPRLEKRLREYKRQALSRPTPRNARSLTQRDALLITYGDQVREPAVPPLRTLGYFLDRHLAGVLSGAHILPFYPSSSDDGFSVIDYGAVDPGLGEWSEIRRIGGRFDLMFDAVFNHISARSEWFQRFLKDDPLYRDFFIVVEGDPDLSQVVRPRALPLLTRFPTAGGEKKVWTTFSADQIDLNFRNPEVLLAVVDALLFYVTQGARFIRLDAIAYLWKEPGTACIHLPQTHRVIQLLRALLDEVAPEVRLITETNVPHADNISYFGDGAHEAQLVYNFALPPLVLHTIQTGNATALTHWAASLQLPSDQVTFFNFLASHDGIGVNPVRGILRDVEIDALVQRALAHGGLVSYKFNPDGSRSPYELNITYFDALSNPNDTEPLRIQVDRFLVAQAIMLAIIGIPGIYFHSLFGSRNDRAAADASGIPRRINRQKLAQAELETALADSASLRAQVFAGYQKLLQVRRAHPAFHPAGPCQVLSCGPSAFALLRTSPDRSERVFCVHNVSATPTRVTIPAATPENERRLTNLFDATVHDISSTGKTLFELRPYEAVWAKM
jgi:glycosidase